MTEVETIPTLINGKWTLRLPEHRANRPEWISGWEPERLDSMSKNIGPDDVVFDIGTEEGDLSALYQQWIGTGDGGVVLVEPNPRVWPNPKLIFKANRLKAPLATFVGFCGDVNRGDYKAALSEGWPKCADGDVIGDHGFCQLNERPDIPSITVRSLAARTTNPTVITMDVEGSEFQVLRGAEVVLIACKPLLYISVHPTFMVEQYQTDPQDLYDFLRDMGYRTKILAEDHEVHVLAWNPFKREPRF